jgi:hypothetical protein
VRARFSAPLQTGPGAQPTSCTMSTGSFPEIKSGRGVTLTQHPLLVPWHSPYGPYDLYRASVPVQGGTLPFTFLIYAMRTVGGDSSVGIATRYGLDGPGIESRWKARFSAPVQSGPGAHPASCTMGTGYFPRVEQPGRGGNHPSPHSVEVKERVQLYVYSPSGASRPVLK